MINNADHLYGVFQGTQSTLNHEFAQGCLQIDLGEDSVSTYT